MFSHLQHMVFGATHLSNTDKRLKSEQQFQLIICRSKSKHYRRVQARPWGRNSMVATTALPPAVISISLPYRAPCHDLIMPTEIKPQESEEVSSALIRPLGNILIQKELQHSNCSRRNHLHHHHDHHNCVTQLGECSLKYWEKTNIILTLQEVNGGRQFLPCVKAKISNCFDVVCE